jgi:integrase
MKMKLLRTSYPKVRLYVKSRNKYCQVDLRRKGYVGKHFKNFTTQQAALDFAAKIGDAVAENGITALAKVKDPQMAALEQQCAIYGKTVQDAVSVALGHWATELKKLESPFVEGLFDQWYTEKSEGIKKLRPKTLKSILDMSKELKKSFAGLRLNQITEKAVENYLKGKDVSEQTRKNYCGYLSQFLNWAIFKKLTKENPAEYWFKQIHVPKGAVKFYTHEEISEVFREAIKTENRSMLAYFALAIFTGIRPEEIEKLKWDENIKMDTKEIFIPHTVAKTKKDRLFEMPNEMVFAWLQRAKEYNLPLIPEANVKNLRKKMVKKLDFKFISDGYRHTFCTYDYAKHKNLERLRHIMGNSPNIIERFYKGAIAKEQIEKYHEILPAVFDPN